MNKACITCAIVDDEPLSVKLLSNYVNLTPGLQLIYSSTSASKAIEFFKNNNADLLFLDIQMPEINGLEIGKALTRKTRIILTSAYQEYAINGYDLNVIDFLLKPITQERFHIAVEKAFDRINKPSLKKTDKNYIFIKVEQKNVKIFLDDMVYIEGLRDYVAVYARNEKYLTLESIKNLESILGEQFIRIHKSYLINTKHIKLVERNTVLLNSHRLPIGDTYKSEFLKRLGI